MATVSTLIVNIVRDLARSDTSISDIVLVDIQSSIKEYESNRFYFNERSLSITLSSTNTYALSLWVATDATLADIIEIDEVSVLVNGNRRYGLDEVSFSRWRGMDSGPAFPTGNPSYYTVYNQAVRIDSYPNPAITGTLDCHVRLVELVNMADTNAWTNDASELIRYATLKRLWGIRYKDPAQAEVAANGEARALAALQRKTSALAGHRLESSL